MRKKERKILREIAAHAKEINQLVKPMDQAGEVDENSLDKMLKNIRRIQEKTVVLRYLHVNMEEEMAPEIPAPVTEEQPVPVAESRKPEGRTAANSRGVAGSH